ncbi:unnamed protein product [Rotaria sordida]|uniref:Uncharacterized protein n=1 Tax=Rotaria sordida TaxID=392033 RepID=A0A815A1Z3_9BILA|nr:unnamed protein product [Rotaria sordida]
MTIEFRVHFIDCVVVSCIDFIFRFFCAITNMLSLRFALLLLIVLYVNGQTTDINSLNSTNAENNDPVDKLHIIEEGQYEKLISSNDAKKPQLTENQTLSVQPLSSPCIGAYPSKKLAYRKDKTKYILCSDEFHYEILSCLNDGEYNEQTNSCERIITTINKCEEEKPCLHNGHCVPLLNSTFKCICHSDWTGNKCEIPINSCVKNPCGSNALCRTLKMIDYEQDYVCICDQSESYGLNCQDVVRNPCLTSNEQFFPYAFSQRAYIQCDGDIIHFQPCSTLLFWNQEETICDRKRPTKVHLQKLLTKLISKTKNKKHHEKIVENINKEIITTTTTTTTTIQNEQKKKDENENHDSSTFIPTTVTHTEELQSNMDIQQSLVTQNVPEETPESSEPLLESVDSKQIHQDSQIENTTSLTIPSERNQPLSQTTQQELISTSTEVSSTTAYTDDQSETTPENQQQNFPQSNQPFTTQKLDQTTEITTTQNNEHILPQSTQESYTTQYQQQFQKENFLETTTQSYKPIHSQDFQNHEKPIQSWPKIPADQFTRNQFLKSLHLNRKHNQNFAPQSQSWQGYQINRIQPWLHDRNQQSWQNKGNNQIHQNSIQSETSSMNIEQLPVKKEQNFVSQSIQNQSWIPTHYSDPNNDQLQREEKLQNNQQQEKQNLPQTNPVFGTQQWLNRIPEKKPLNYQHTFTQLQSGQESHITPNQHEFQDQSQETFLETTTQPYKIFLLQGFQNPQKHEQSQQHKFFTQQINDQPIKSHVNQHINFQPRPWQRISKPSRILEFPLANRNKEYSIIDTSSQIPNSQFELNQQHQDLFNQNSFEQKQPWSSNQQFQNPISQSKDFDDLKLQTSQGFTTHPVVSSQNQPSLQTGQQLNANSFETTTKSNENILPGHSIQHPHQWQSSRTVEQQQQHQSNHNQIEQEKAQDSLPTLSSGSWNY